jgi:Resolvase, N terminal domain
MLVGYMRVSTNGDRQVLDLQRDALLSAGVDERHLFEDRATGSRGDRIGLAKALAPSRARRAARWSEGSRSQASPVSVEKRTRWSAVTTRPSRAAARRWAGQGRHGLNCSRLAGLRHLQGSYRG